jgi:hypothetical protein
MANLSAGDEPAGAMPAVQNGLYVTTHGKRYANQDCRQVVTTNLDYRNNQRNAQKTWRKRRAANRAPPPRPSGSVIAPAGKISIQFIVKSSVSFAVAIKAE